MYTVTRVDTRPDVNVPFFTITATPDTTALIAEVTIETTVSPDGLVQTNNFTWPTQELFVLFINNSFIIQDVVAPRINYNAANMITSAFTYPV